MRQVWVVLYVHKHGADAWPIFEDLTEEQVIDGLRRDGSWDNDEEGSVNYEKGYYVEVRGPFQIPRGFTF